MPASGCVPSSVTPICLVLAVGGILLVGASGVCAQELESGQLLVLDEDDPDGVFLWALDLDTGQRHEVTGGGLSSPSDVEINPRTGEIYVVDSPFRAVATVYKIDPVGGGQIELFATRTPVDQVDLELSSSGELLLATKVDDEVSVVRFNPISGAQNFVSLAEATSQLMAVAADGALWFTEAFTVELVLSPFGLRSLKCGGSNEVLRFDAESGDLLATILLPESVCAIGIGFDPQGRLLISDLGETLTFPEAVPDSPRVVRFTHALGLFETFEGIGAFALEASAEHGILVAAAGRIWRIDEAAGGILVLISDEFVSPVSIAEIGAGGCLANTKVLCLNQGRFSVVVEWIDFEGNSGRGDVVPFSSVESGLFSFFSPDNWEIQVKVLDACGFNNHFWVFAAATTNVAYTLRIMDTETGQVREYTNELGERARAITDTAAFATCP